jgi:hypothetical protein
MTEKTLPSVSKHGNFHTHANLTQTLDTIITQHFNDIRATSAAATPKLPQFMAEAVHMICYNLAGAINGNPFEAESWQSIAEYSLATVEIIKQAQATEEARKAEAAAQARASEVTPTQ